MKHDFDPIFSPEDTDGRTDWLRVAVGVVISFVTLALVYWLIGAPIVAAISFASLAAIAVGLLLA